MTSRSLCREDFLTWLERAATAGPAGVILQEKDLSPEDYRALAGQALTLCRARGMPCTLHSFPETAEALEERATHLPLPLLRILSSERRRVLRVLGTSRHSAEDARGVEKLGCIYITAGYVFAADCKKGLAPRGPDFFRAVRRAVDLPVQAIGGITPENFPPVRAVGARGGCATSGLMTCADPAALLGCFARRD